MKKASIEMSLLMGVTLSFFLSLTGTLSSGHFTIPDFLLSFAVSFVISLIIGFLVPMHKVTAALDKKLGIKPHTLGARFFDSLVSNIIYTPIISFCMVTMAYLIATSHGARLPYVPMLIKSLILTFIVGYILIFIFMPLYMKLVFKRNGIKPGGPPANKQGGNPQ